MNMYARTCVLASAALFFAIRITCTEGVLTSQPQATAAVNTETDKRSITFSPEDNQKMSALREQIRRNNEYVAAQNQEIESIRQRKIRFENREQTNDSTSEEVERYMMGFNREIGNYQEVVEKINCSSQAITRAINEIREANLKRLGATLPTGAVKPPAPKVPAANITVTTKIPETFVEQTSTAQGTTTTVTSNSADTTVTVGVVDPNDATVPAVPEKEGWSLTSKIMAGVLAAGAVIALIIIVLYLQKS